MKKHVRIYREFFDLCEDDRAICEVCGREAVDVHHIFARGQGGSDEHDFIENLIGLCREHHDMYGDKKQHFDFLIDQHFAFIDWFRDDYTPTLERLEDLRLAL